MSTNTNNVAGLRATLMDTLRSLGAMGREGVALDLEQVRGRVEVAKAMKGLADTLVDSARLELDYLKQTDKDRVAFLDAGAEAAGVALPLANGVPMAHNPFPVSARHRLEG